MRLWRLSLLLWALAACGGDGGAIIGKSCGDGDACASTARSACILRWPDGYCTEFDCTLGACPSGSRCVNGVTFQDVSFDAFCLDECASENDCRAGYACVSTEGAMVCVPRN